MDMNHIPKHDLLTSRDFYFEVPVLKMCKSQMKTPVCLFCFI